eukprot:Sspe_Gene.30145::Locus_14767_Transcript_1_1_Confidence_1.000_Length_2630::g.30145::m.30145
MKAMGTAEEFVWAREFATEQLGVLSREVDALLPRDDKPTRVRQPIVQTEDAHRRRDAMASVLLSTTERALRWRWFALWRSRVAVKKGRNGTKRKTGPGSMGEDKLRLEIISLRKELECQKSAAAAAAAKQAILEAQRAREAVEEAKPYRPRRGKGSRVEEGEGKRKKSLVKVEEVEVLSSEYLTSDDELPTVTDLKQQLADTQARNEYLLQRLKLLECKEHDLREALAPSAHPASPLMGGAAGLTAMRGALPTTDETTSTEGDVGDVGDVPCSTQADARSAEQVIQELNQKLVEESTKAQYAIEERDRLEAALAKERAHSTPPPLSPKIGTPSRPSSVTEILQRHSSAARRIGSLSNMSQPSGGEDKGLQAEVASLKAAMARQSEEAAAERERLVNDRASLAVELAAALQKPPSSPPRSPSHKSYQVARDELLDELTVAQHEIVEERTRVMKQLVSEEEADQRAALLQSLEAKERAHTTVRNRLAAALAARARWNMVTKSIGSVKHDAENPDEKLGAMARDLEAAKGEAAALRIQVAELKAELVSSEGKAERAVERCESLRIELSAARDNPSEDGDVVRLHNKLEVVEEQFALAKQEHRAVSEEYEALKDRHALVSRRCEELEAMLSQSKEVNTSQQLELQTTQARCASTQAELQRTKVEMAQLASDRDAALERLEGCLKELEGIRLGRSSPTGSQDTLVKGIERARKNAERAEAVARSCEAALRCVVPPEEGIPPSTSGSPSRRHHFTIAPIEKLVRKQAGDRLGALFRSELELILEDIEAGTPAHLSDLEECIGLRLTHVNNVQVTCCNKVRSLSQGASELSLRFDPLVHKLTPPG